MSEKTVLIEEKGKFILYKQEDLTPYAELAYEERKIAGKNFSKGKTLRKIASIPITAILAEPVEVQMELIRNPKFLKKWLKTKHPEFITCEGNL